jgi:hypothetical protein
MGKFKNEQDRLIAVNCTISKSDLELAEMMGRRVVDGKTTVNTSLGLRQVFEAVRKFGLALQVLENIRANPRQSRKLVDAFLGPVDIKEASSDS